MACGITRDLPRWICTCRLQAEAGYRGSTMNKPQSSSYLEHLTERILLEARSHIGLSQCEPVNIVRRTKDLKFGDFILFVPSQLRQKLPGLRRSGGSGAPSGHTSTSRKDSDSSDSDESSSYGNKYFPGLEPSDPDLTSLPGLGSYDGKFEEWGIPGLDRSTSGSSAERYGVDRSISHGSENADDTNLLDDVLRLRPGQYLLRLRREPVFQYLLTNIRSLGDSYGFISTTRVSEAVSMALISCASLGRDSDSRGSPGGGVSRCGSARRGECRRDSLAVEGGSDDLSDVSVGKAGLEREGSRKSQISQMSRKSSSRRGSTVWVGGAEGVSNLTLDQLRIILVTRHVESLLNANGMSTAAVGYDWDVQQIFDQLLRLAINPSPTASPKSTRSSDWLLDVSGAELRTLVVLRALFDELLEGSDAYYKQYVDSTETYSSEKIDIPDGSERNSKTELLAAALLRGAVEEEAAVEENGELEIGEVCKSSVEAAISELRLDLKKLITELVLEGVVHVRTYHKNISTVALRPSSAIFTQIYSLELSRRNLVSGPISSSLQEEEAGSQLISDRLKFMKTSDDEPDSSPVTMLDRVSTNEEGARCKQSCDWLVVHVTTNREEFVSQQMELAWRALVSEVRNLKQLRVVCGGVSVRGSTTPVLSAVDFIRLRLHQTQEAFLSKYGQSTIGWESTMKELVKAVIKFELLTTVSRQEVKLDLSEIPDEEIEIKGHARGHKTGGGGSAVFVMYNSARLTTLFTRFHRAVSQGIYPAIPEPGAIKYSALRELDEWELLFCFLLPFEELVRDCVTTSLTSSSNKPTQNETIHTHRICQFLVDLSHRLSAYYCRTHVLAEPRSHLTAQMHARLTLLLCVQQVMRNALHLLDISPLAQL